MEANKCDQSLSAAIERGRPTNVGKFVPGPMRSVCAANAGKELVSTIGLATFENIILPPPEALLSRMACRNEPGPESLVLVT